MSASYALINRIKSLEQQKKRNNQLSSTAIKAATAAAAAAASAAIQATPISTAVSTSYRVPNNYQRINNINSTSNNNLTNDILIESMHSMNINNPSPVNNPPINSSPNQERKSAKFNRNLVTSFSKSQEELFKIRTKSANPNAYQDKITDQKFFNRNFKLKSDSSTSINDYNNSINNSNPALNGNIYLQQQQQQRYLNDSPSTTDSFYHSSKIYNSNTNLNTNNSFYDKDPNRNSFILSNHSPINPNQNQNNYNQQTNNNNANHLNKLKLLKKRNALKKSLSNATAVQGSAATVSTANTSNKSLDPLNISSFSREDLKLSHNSLNNLTSVSIITTRNLNQHLSRYSLNNIDSSHNTSLNTTVLNNSYSYPQLNNNYSINKSSETIDETNLSELKQNNMSFRAKSTGPNLLLPNPGSINKTKSENEINDEKYTTQTFQQNSMNKSISNINDNYNNVNTTTNSSNNFNSDKAVLNKLMNLNDENTMNNQENDAVVETIDLVEFTKRIALTSASNAKLEKNKPTIMKPQSAAVRPELQNQQQEQVVTPQVNVSQMQINDSRLNKAVLANTTYLNRVKNGSSTHYNSINTNNINISTDNQRNYSFNNNNQRVKSGKITQVVTIKRDTSNESIERNSKIKLSNDNFPANYRNIYNSGPEIINKSSNGYVEYTLDQLDPNNIMSDPVISEQFHKLYAEDEYFQAVHKKCTEWLSRYLLKIYFKKRFIKTNFDYC